MIDTLWRAYSAVIVLGLAFLSLTNASLDATLKDESTLPRLLAFEGKTDDFVGKTLGSYRRKLRYLDAWVGVFLGRQLFSVPAFSRCFTVALVYGAALFGIAWLGGDSGRIGGTTLLPNDLSLISKLALLLGLACSALAVAVVPAVHAIFGRGMYNMTHALTREVLRCTSAGALGGVIGVIGAVIVAKTLVAQGDQNEISSASLMLAFFAGLGAVFGWRTASLGRTLLVAALGSIFLTATLSSIGITLGFGIPAFVVVLALPMVGAASGALYAVLQALLFADNIETPPARLLPFAILGATLALHVIVVGVLETVNQGWSLLILFIVVLPAINAGFDLLSWAATRYLWRQTRHHLCKRGRRAVAACLGFAFLDLFLALILLAGLAVALVFGISAMNRLSASFGGQGFDLIGYIRSIESGPAAGIWASLMLFSTLLPTALHLFVATLSAIICIIPQSLRGRIVGSLAARPLQSWDILKFKARSLVPVFVVLGLPIPILLVLERNWPVASWMQVAWSCIAVGVRSVCMALAVWLD